MGGQDRLSDAGKELPTHQRSGEDLEQLQLSLPTTRAFLYRASSGYRGRRGRGASPTIIAVPLFNTYKSCVSCKARVESTTPPLGRCSRCSILQRVDRCGEQVSAKLMLQQPDSTTTRTLSEFGSLAAPANCSSNRGHCREPPIDALPVAALTYNNNNVITTVTYSQN